MNILLTDLKSLPVERNGLFNVSLFAFDVGKIIEGVGVVRVHPKSSIIALLCFRNLPIKSLLHHHRRPEMLQTLPCSLSALAKLQYASGKLGCNSMARRYVSMANSTRLNIATQNITIIHNTSTVHGSSSYPCS